MTANVSYNIDFFCLLTKVNEQHQPSRRTPPQYACDHDTYLQRCQNARTQNFNTNRDKIRKSSFISTKIIILILKTAS